MNMGITPYRGTSRTSSSQEDYYNSTRYKGFENFLRAEANRQDVIIEKTERVTGVWEGNAEPATSIWLTGTGSGIRNLADAIGSRYNQDSVMIFEPDDSASGFIYTLTNIQSTIQKNEIAETLRLFGITGARLGANKDLEIADPDGSVVRQAIALAQILKAHLTYSRGYVIFRTKGKDYE